MSKRIDLTGQRFGRLTVVKFAGYKKRSNGYNVGYWQCMCQCGRSSVVSTSHLTSGWIRSCGCLQRETAREVHIKHGGQGTRLYSIWKNMISRTGIPGQRSYDYYGGRGITVCEEWKKDFEQFRNWAMRHGYQDHLTIDRIDVNGDYCQENCRWVTMKKQNNNKRNNVRISYNGETLTLAEWSEKLGIKEITLWQRIYAYGWTIEKAFETPVDERKSKRNK